MGSDFDHGSSNYQAGEYEQEVQKITVSEQVNGLQYTSTNSDSFVMDMESFSQFVEKDNTSNSRITLQRNLSRKGLSRGGGEKKFISTSCNERDPNLLTNSPKATLHGESTTEKLTAVSLGPTNHSVAPLVHHQITITNSSMSNTSEENRLSAKRNSFRRSNSWAISPRRLLLFFATLSSMGTMLLIYFTLSMSKLNGDGNTLE